MPPQNSPLRLLFGLLFGTDFGAHPKITFCASKASPRSQLVPVLNPRAPFWGPKGPKVKKRGSQNGPRFGHKRRIPPGLLLQDEGPGADSTFKNNSNPCTKATWTAFEKGSVSPPLAVFRSAENAPTNRWMLFFAPPFYVFLAEPAPPKGPFLEILEFWRAPQNRHFAHRLHIRGCRK